MLGSLDDADDAVQESFLRAWRGIDRFEPRAPFRAWLYRIATNVCLSTLAQTARRAEISTTQSATSFDGSTSQEGDEVLVHPYPDRLLEEHFGATPDPAATTVESFRAGFGVIVVFAALSVLIAMFAFPRVGRTAMADAHGVTIGAEVVGMSD